ncbi:hypothetical protein [Solibacillus sp. CAU 1738]|uniref:hypothetical protein n=1 Tax=Solibacillus sp. CAU 1738 TaxID=3140363 RepID=UPI003260A39C
MTHITCLNALAILGSEVINDHFLAKSQQPDSVKIATGDLKYLKSASDTKILGR